MATNGRAAAVRPRVKILITFTVSPCSIRAICRNSGWISGVIGAKQPEEQPERTGASNE